MRQNGDLLVAILFEALRLGKRHGTRTILGMAEDFLAAFLGRPNRARVLRVFVLNQSQVFSAAQAAKRAGSSSSTVSREIKALEQVGILKKAKFSIQVGKAKKVVMGKQKEQAWSFNPDFKHASALSKFVHETAPGREIRYAVFSTPEFRYRLTIQDRLIRDTLDYPHLVLLDKTRLL